MGVYDKAELFQQVLRILPNVQAIGVTGSAAFEGEHFRKDSDIDVVALNPTSCYAWGELSGHTLEIHAYDIERMKKAIRNPQWHGPNWIWNIGKIGGAEHLFGRSLENIVRRQITSSTRLVAGAALIGYLLLAASKERTGRRRASVDVPLILTALRRVVSGTFPIRALADDDLAAFSLTSDFSKEFENAKILAQEAGDVLCSNERLARITYFPEHREGLCWLRRSMGVDLEMPHICRSV